MTDPIFVKSPRGMSTAATEKRWDLAVDRVLNSGLMYPYIDDFFAYLDDKITYEEFNERMSP